MRELLRVKCRPENIFFTTKNNFHSGQSIQGVIRPLVATLVRAIRLVIALLHHAMNSSTPSIVYLRQGKTTSNMVRSCDTVRAALSPSAASGATKEMREHRHQHMVMPARVLAPFIVVHPELRFAFCKALLDGPP